MIEERPEKKVRIVPDSIGYLINGTNVGEVHAGLENEDAEAIREGKAKLVAAIVENGKKVIIIGDPIPPITPEPDDPWPPKDNPEPDNPWPPKDNPEPDNPWPPKDNPEPDDPWPPKDDPEPYDPWPPKDDYEPEEPLPPKGADERDDKKKKILGIPIPIGIAIPLIATLGLTGLLKQCNTPEIQGLNLPEIPPIELENPFVDVHEEHYVEQSGVAKEGEITDLYQDDYGFLRGSQVRSPGEIIDELRNAGWAENLGREEGRAEYDSRSGEDRANDETEIQNINYEFEKQTQIIQENRSIIEDKSTSQEEKEKALKRIKSAKEKQRDLYANGIPLLDRYRKEAEKAVLELPDDRTNLEVREYEGATEQYYDGLDNLQRDIDRLDETIETNSNPEQHEGEFFDKTPEQSFEAEDKGEVINTIEAFGPFGHREVIESEVESQLDAKPNHAGQMHEGLIDTTQAREVTVRETRYGISAVFHKIGDYINSLVKATAENEYENVGNQKAENEETPNKIEER